MRFCATGFLLLSACAVPCAAVADPSPALVFCCAPDNDLAVLAAQCGIAAQRYDRIEDAIAAAPESAGLLMLADGYPEKSTAFSATLARQAAKKHLRVYIEYPAWLPGLEVAPPTALQLERVVATSDAFGAPLPRMHIAQINAFHLVPVHVSDAHLVAAKVAGVDKAVFGLGDTPSRPVLFEHPNGRLLVSTTKLSHCVTGRYLPQAAWATVWKMIFTWLRPGQPVEELHWIPVVRPSYTATETLPPDAESQALERAARWYVQSRILRHPEWPKEALDWANTYNTVRDRPRAEWPRGDGSLGLLEGYSSTIRLDGSQPMRYAVRNDCMTEAAMALAFSGARAADAQRAETAGKLLDFVYTRSPLAQGPRSDPASPSYGLIGWALDNPDKYWGDDNARAMLATLASGKLLESPRWNEAVTRCLLANLRTSGKLGFREGCVTQKALEERGWKAFWNSDFTLYSPHYEGWLWACFLWAYDKTGYAPFREKSTAAIGRLMAAYPEHWDWVIRSAQIERARALLPLAWLIRVDDTPEHRRWLRTVAEDLLAAQDDSGAIGERLGGVQQAVASNKEYGTGEIAILQQNGDSLSDCLYTCNFALLGLHEAAAATGEAFYREAEDRLARYLCRIQVRSEAHPELDGAWYRGFDFRRWEFWASNADWEWGAWCTESGWGTPWIAGTLALRQMKTSLWELTAGVKIAEAFEKYRSVMLPDLP